MLLLLMNEKGNEERGAGNCFFLNKCQKNPMSISDISEKNVGGSLFAWSFMWFRKPICNPLELKSHLSLLSEW